MTQTADTTAGGSRTRLEYGEVREPSFLEELLRDSARRLPFAIALVACVLGVSLALYHLYVAAFGTPEGRSFRSIHLTVMLVLAVLLKPLFRSSYRDPIFIAGDGRNALRATGFGIDMVLVGIAVFIQVWTTYDVEAFHLR